MSNKHIDSFSFLMLHDGECFKFSTLQSSSVLSVSSLVLLFIISIETAEIHSFSTAEVTNTEYVEENTLFKAQNDSQIS